MKINFKNSNRKYLFLLLVFYFISLTVLFVGLEFHMSKLGDNIHYERGVFTLSLNPEEVTTNFYTILSYLGVPTFIVGLAVAIYISYCFANHLKFTALNLIIFFSIMNPFIFQFLIYASKELLITCFTLLIYKFKNYKSLVLILLIFIFLIRPLFCLATLVLILLYEKQIFFIRLKNFSLFLSISILSYVFYLEFTGQILVMTQYIKSLFLAPYANVTTNRYWLPSVDTILSNEFLVWLGVGFYTIFFSFIDAPSLMIRLLTTVVGIGKILLIYNFFKIKFLYGYLWFLTLIICVLPISIYNVGSSLRFSVPVMIIMLYSYITLQMKDENK